MKSQESVTKCVRQKKGIQMQEREITDARGIGNRKRDKKWKRNTREMNWNRKVMKEKKERQRIRQKME